VPLLERRTFAYLLIAGVLCAVLFFPAIYALGLALAPPPPAAAATPVPRLVADALWARANGGRAAELTPITPFSMARLATCVALEDFKDTTPGDARRVEACQQHLPALLGFEYLSRSHMRDAGMQPSFREGLGRLSTTVWMTHAWTKADFLSTLAERGEVGAGFRGVDAAAHGYFRRRPEQLTLPEAAVIGALMGQRTIDPWCRTEAVTASRNLILERMHANGAITETELRQASAAPLELAPPPEGRPECRD
jgi:hypothetical protein